MPSTNFFVGNQLVPVPTAGQDSAITDPTLDGLLGYFGHWLKFAFDAKFSEMRGPDTSAAITDACPAGNRFPWDHRNTFMRPHNVGGGTLAVPLPGLWLWETSILDAEKYHTLWYDAHIRTLRMAYIFPQIQIPDGMRSRSGIIATAGRVIRKAVVESRHPTFAWNGGPPGASILNTLNLIGLGITQMQSTVLLSVPTNNASNGMPSNTGQIQRFFPALDVTLNVIERVDQWLPVYPDDALVDDEVTLNETDGSGDPIELLIRDIPGPDDLA